MCGDNNERETTNCLNDLLRKILMLQKQDFDGCCQSNGCDKPYLGPVCSTICYNTRPLTLFNCCTGNEWSFPYTINGVTGESEVFRIESLDDECATFIILYLNTDGNYASTNEYFTISLNCVGAVKCLPDTYVELC